MGRFANLAFTPSVAAVQERLGSRKAYARIAAAGETRDVIGPDEAAFIGERDSFYMASVGETGWPYVQHRGGPKGFVKVLDEHTLGFADYRGNRQYVSVGNVSRDDRVALIFVDYPNRARVKVLAHASTTEDPKILARLGEGDEGAKVERGFLLHVEGLDWNCPQHITPRFTEDEVLELVAPFAEKLRVLEGKNRELEAELARSRQAGGG